MEAINGYVGFAREGERIGESRQHCLPLKDAVELGVSEASEKHGCSKCSIYDWRRQQTLAVLATTTTFFPS